MQLDFFLMTHIVLSLPKQKKMFLPMNLMVFFLQGIIITVSMLQHLATPQPSNVTKLCFKRQTERREAEAHLHTCIRSIVSASCSCPANATSH